MAVPSTRSLYSMRVQLLRQFEILVVHNMLLHEPSVSPRKETLVTFRLQQGSVRSHGSKLHIST